jgi:hypothetical protein
LIGLHESVVGAFEAARQAPGAPYEPERFLAFLTVPPARGKRVADTFGGRRRLVRFLNQVQMQHAVCFTSAEWEAAHTLDQFVTLVEKKASRPEVALCYVEQQVAGARRRLVDQPLKFGILTLPLLAGAWFVSSVPLRVVLALAWLAINGGVALLSWRDLAYHRRLLERIEGRAGQLDGQEET